MKTLFITGGNNGIGFHMVKEWLRRGNCAAAADLSGENLAELKDIYADRLLYLECDVRSEQEMISAVKSAKENFGSIDYAVHNACVYPFKSFEEHTHDDYRSVMQVNLSGAINLAKAALPYMLAQKSGRIYFTSSGVGVTGFSNISAYSASKGAIEALAKCLNIEYKKSGVSFHLLHPPLTDTKSSSPLPVPKEFKASAEKVGAGLVKWLDKNKFIIAHSAGGAFNLRMSYLFPVAMGKLLAKMTDRAGQ